MAALSNLQTSMTRAHAHTLARIPWTHAQTTLGWIDLARRSLRHHYDSAVATFWTGPAAAVTAINRGRGRSTAPNRAHGRLRLSRPISSFKLSYESLNANKLQALL